MSKNFSISGLNHLGLVVKDIQIAKTWFHDTLGLPIMEDRGELVFLKAGKDIIAIKTKKMAVAKPEHLPATKEQEASADDDFSPWQHLDHYGFYASSKEEVDAFTEFLKAHEIPIIKGPYDRKDGRSVYFKDPCGLVGEYLFVH